MKKIKKLFNEIIVLQFLFLIGIIIGISLLVNKCNKILEKEETTLIEQLGKEIGSIKKEFNKGYNANDTLIIDTLIVK